MAYRYAHLCCIKSIPFICSKLDDVGYERNIVDKLSTKENGLMICPFMLHQIQSLYLLQVGRCWLLMVHLRQIINKRKRLNDMSICAASNPFLLFAASQTCWLRMEHHQQIINKRKWLNDMLIYAASNPFVIFGQSWTMLVTNGTPLTNYQQK